MSTGHSRKAAACTPVTPPADAPTWWLRTALGDLGAARALAGSNGVPPRTAVHLAHQAAEKALKAIIASRGDRPDRTHDLVFLRDRCPRAVQLAMAHIDVAALSEALLPARYPAFDEPAIGSTEVQRRLGEASEIIEISTIHLRGLGLLGSELSLA